MSSLSRLSPLNVEDEIVRGYLFKTVLAYANDQTNTDYTEYEIKTDEEYRPDLASHRLYGTPDLRWVVSLLADVEDESEPLPVGSVFRFPPVAWLREQVRHFADGGGL